MASARGSVAASRYMPNARGHARDTWTVLVPAALGRPMPGGGHAEPAGAGAGDGLRDLLDWAAENAVAAALRGCPPDSAEAAQMVSRILEPVPGEHPVTARS